MDKQIIAALGNRRRFFSLRDLVPTAMVNPETAVILAWYEAYFSAFKDAECIELPALKSYVQLRSKKADPNATAITMHMLDRLEQDPVPEDQVRGIVDTLHELDLQGKVGALLTRFDEGDDIELSYELQMLAIKARASIAEGGKPKWESGSILESLEGETDAGGLQWFAFAPLAAALRGLRPGDNIGLAAPTDKGKTSLLCWLIMHFQKQAAEMGREGDQVYAGRPTLVLINEGTAARVRNRLYGTIAQVERDKLIEMARDGSLDSLFEREMGGHDMVRCVNIHGKNMAEVSRIIEENNPHLVISDMTGRIKATSNKSGGANDIGQLEEVWDGFRQLGAIHGFAHIGTVQVSAEGFDDLYPPLSALQNSKVGIQTTWDLGLVMGALENPDARFLRGLSTPKNKMSKSGQSGLVQMQAVFEPGINNWS